MSDCRCPYCQTPHASFAEARDCSNNCWENRVKPLPSDLMLAVLQSRMTLKDAEAQAASAPERQIRL